MTGETYKLQCHACGRTVMLPAIDGTQSCPNCGAALVIQWRPARAEFGHLGKQQEAGQVR